MSATQPHDELGQEQPFKPVGLLEILIAQLNKGKHPANPPSLSRLGH